jgi:hypothetical protein
LTVWEIVATEMWPLPPMAKREIGTVAKLFSKPMRYSNRPKRWPVG